MKTRFAPSPTGYIHIGNVRSAIYPYLLAKQQNGKFVLRIEDTDRARFVEGATELIEDVLKWLGLDWGEGPVIGGPNGPYFQSERKAIYLEYAKKLLRVGRAYADDTDSKTIDKYRETCYNEKRPFLYRDFRPETPPEWHEGLPIRFKADPKPRNWHDEVMGDLEAGPETQDDIILIKADGMPTYNFAHIVDDFLMEISYVIRGVEYLPSVPNYLALYEALGIETPKLVSLPHILAPSGNKKLGKRDGAKSVTEYRDDGILPEAMLNYLANLGWNDGTEQEIYTKDELIEKFSLGKVQKSGARYDETKLLWMNGQWIRKLVDEHGVKEFYPRTAGFWPKSAESAKNAKSIEGTESVESTKSANDEKKIKVLGIIYDRLKTLGDLKEMTGYFFEDPAIDLEMIFKNKALKKLSETEVSELLQKSAEKLEKVENWHKEELQEALNELLAETESKPAVLFSAIRIAVSFAPFSPALPLTLEVLGRDTVLARIRNVITAISNG